LELIDCHLDDPEALYGLLRIFRSLKCLSICSDFENRHNITSSEEEIAYDKFFAAISRTPARQSLQSLRFDISESIGFVAPAPGVHQLRGVKHLEMTPDHLQMNYWFKDQDDSDDFAISRVKCPLECLLPPNLEVLKITPLAEDKFEDLENILERKSELVPHLRKIIVSSEYRSEAMSKELRVAYHSANKGRFSNTRYLFPPHTEKDEFPYLAKACRKEGVELLIVYEDTTRKEVMEEGAGPPVWEIPEQMK